MHAWEYKRQHQNQSEETRHQVKSKCGERVKHQKYLNSWNDEVLVLWPIAQGRRIPSNAYPRRPRRRRPVENEHLEPTRRAHMRIWRCGHSAKTVPESEPGHDTSGKKMRWSMLPPCALETVAKERDTNVFCCALVRFRGELMLGAVCPVGVDDRKLGPS